MIEIKEITLEKIYNLLKDEKIKEIQLIKEVESEYGRDVDSYTFSLDKNTNTIIVEIVFQAEMNTELNYMDTEKYRILGNEVEYRDYSITEEEYYLKTSPMSEFIFDYTEIRFK